MTAFGGMYTVALERQGDRGLKETAERGGASCPEVLTKWWYSGDQMNMNELLNVLLTCFIACQYSETNVMHFSFSLLRLKGLYMFRALLAHPQEV
jgi:hypothetical protein